MRWTAGGGSSDIEDRRGEGGGGGFNLGGFNGMHLGIGGTLVLVVLSFLFRTNLFSVLDGGGTAPTAAERPLSNPDAGPAEQREVEFVKFVLNDVQHTWEQLLPQGDTSYRHTKLVLFRDLTQSGCGTAQTETGPFYCPVDEKVFIDLGFFQELRDRFGAPGEFAQATFWRTKLVTTCKNCWGLRVRCTGFRVAIRRRRIRSRSAWNCKRIASQECGATQPPNERSSMIRTSQPASAPLARWGTTACSA